MGRRIELKRIGSPLRSQITYSKRRSCIIRKANEIGILCDVDVAFVAFSPCGRLTKFSGPKRMEDMIQDYINLPVDKRNPHINNIQEKLEMLHQFDHIKGGPNKLHHLDKKIESMERQIRTATLELQIYQASLRDFELDPDQEPSLAHILWCERNLKNSLKQFTDSHPELVGNSSTSCGEFQKQGGAPSQDSSERNEQNWEAEHNSSNQLLMQLDPWISPFSSKVRANMLKDLRKKGKEKVGMTDKYTTSNRSARRFPITDPIEMPPLTQVTRVPPSHTTPIGGFPTTNQTEMLKSTSETRTLPTYTLSVGGFPTVDMNEMSSLNPKTQAPPTSNMPVEDFHTINPIEMSSLTPETRAPQNYTLPIGGFPTMDSIEKLSFTSKTQTPPNYTLPIGGFPTMNSIEKLSFAPATQTPPIYTLPIGRFPTMDSIEKLSFTPKTQTPPNYTLPIGGFPTMNSIEKLSFAPATQTPPIYTLPIGGFSTMDSIEMLSFTPETQVLPTYNISDEDFPNIDPIEMSSLTPETQTSPTHTLSIGDFPVIDSIELSPLTPDSLASPTYNFPVGGFPTMDSIEMLPLTPNIPALPTYTFPDEGFPTMEYSIEMLPLTPKTRAPPTLNLTPEQNMSENFDVPITQNQQVGVYSNDLFMDNLNEQPNWFSIENDHNLDMDMNTDANAPANFERILSNPLSCQPMFPANANNTDTNIYINNYSGDANEEMGDENEETWTERFKEIGESSWEWNDNIALSNNLNLDDILM